MRETEEERERTDGRKSVAQYELVRRIPYGEEYPHGAYEAAIPDYVMLDFGLFEEPHDDLYIRCRARGLDKNGDFFAQGHDGARGE
jgi:hypothetical protein